MEIGTLDSQNEFAVPLSAFKYLMSSSNTTKVFNRKFI